MICRAEETHNRLHDVREVVACCDKQGSLLGVARADLINPAQDERTSAILGNPGEYSSISRGGQTHAKLAKPKNNFATMDVLV